MDTLFRIGSVTKSFTGQVLASLAADGIVSLADPLTKYCPEFASMSEGERPVRLIDLATHSAGLPREVPHEPGPPDDPFVNVTPEAFAAWLKANPLLFAPGTAISYSNFGFDLLAAALARAAHQPYADLLEARIVRPLGLRDTTFSPSTEQTGADPAGSQFRRFANAEREHRRGHRRFRRPLFERARSYGLASMASRPILE